MSNLMTKMYKMIEEKNVKNKQLMHGLFEIVRCGVDGPSDANAFEDDAFKQARAEAFIKKYIDSSSRQRDMYLDFVDTNVEFQELGFNIGFQTALKLILESEGRILPFIRLEHETNE
ncbi:MAG: hypothetical protein SPH44_00150 [Eubacteriales bacterium]|nr:hypothetical protein [Eubacteriales bacterium]